MSCITITVVKDMHGNAIHWSEPLADTYQEDGTWLEYAERAGGMRVIGPVKRYDSTARVVWLRDIWTGRDAGPFRGEECRVVPFNAPVHALGAFFAEEAPTRTRSIPDKETLERVYGEGLTPRGAGDAGPSVKRLCG